MIHLYIDFLKDGITNPKNRKSQSFSYLFLVRYIFSHIEKIKNPNDFVMHRFFEGMV
jgi:hypothetical protein